MKILIVDDDNSKIAHIVSEIRGAYEDLQIETEIDITGAIKRVSQTKFDLLIVDLLLPVRAGQTPDEQGGSRLVQEINRNKSLKSPNFIIGVTQYEEFRTKFPSMWNVLIYSPSKNEWRESLKEIIHHIDKASQSKADIDQPHLPTIYVEGKTDALILEETLRIFFPELVNKLRIQFEGGANLVIKKLIVWAFSLSRDSGGQYVKAIGLLDGDKASEEAKGEFYKHVNTEHVGYKLCKIFQLSTQYAKATVPLFKKGVAIHINMEDLFPAEVLLEAEAQRWLEPKVIDDPKGWDKDLMSRKDHLLSLNFEKNESIYLQKVKLFHKEDFCKSVLKLSDEEKGAVLSNFKIVMDEVIDYLFKPV